MNTFLLKEATKMALLTTSTIDPKFEDTDALTELIIAFYENIKAFAHMLQFTSDEIENMDDATAAKLISKYID